MNETKNEKHSVVWNYVFWAWIGVFFIGLFVIIYKYGMANLITAVVLLYPIFIFLFVTPLIIIYPKTNDPFRHLVSFVSMKTKDTDDHHKSLTPRKYSVIPVSCKLKTHKLNTSLILRRLFFLVLGSLTIWRGLETYVNPLQYSKGFPVSKGTGIILFLFGVVILIYGLISKNIPKNYMICLDCRESFAANDVTGSVCPKCNGGIESIEGFYDRHPELKEKP